FVSPVTLLYDPRPATKSPVQARANGWEVPMGKEGVARSSRLRKSWFLAAGALVVVGLTVGFRAQDSPITTASAFTANDLAKVAGENWVTNGGSTMNQRFSSLEQINVSNVSGLKGVFTTHLRNSGVAAKYSGESQPIAYHGVIYVTTGADDVFAVSASTGEIIWEH